MSLSSMTLLWLGKVNKFPLLLLCATLWHFLRGLSFHNSSPLPSLIFLFSSRVLRCRGAMTKLASTIVNLPHQGRELPRPQGGCDKVSRDFFVHHKGASSIFERCPFVVVISRWCRCSFYVVSECPRRYWQIPPEFFPYSSHHRWEDHGKIMGGSWEDTKITPKSNWGHTETSPKPQPPHRAYIGGLHDRKRGAAR